MSRVGKLAIKLDKAKATVGKDEISLEGPKGKLRVRLPGQGIKVEVKDGMLVVTRPDDAPSRCSRPSPRWPGWPG